MRCSICAPKCIRRTPPDGTADGIDGATDSGTEGHSVQDEGARVEVYMLVQSRSNRWSPLLGQQIHDIAVSQILGMGVLSALLFRLEMNEAECSNPGNLDSAMASECTRADYGFLIIDT